MKTGSISLGRSGLSSPHFVLRLNVSSNFRKDGCEILVIFQDAVTANHIFDAIAKISVINIYHGAIIRMLIYLNGPLDKDVTKK